MARADYRPANLPPGFRKPRTEFTDERKAVFLEEFAATGRVIVSALHAGVTDYAVRNALKSDERFAEAYNTARQFFCDLLEQEAQRRGREGWDEPVYQKGQRVMEPVFDPETGEPKRDADNNVVLRPAVVRRFSDRMLELLLKRHIEEYRDKKETGVHVHGDVGVLVIPGGEKTNEVDWDKKYDQAIDASFERVDPQVGPAPVEAPENTPGVDDNPDECDRVPDRKRATSSVMKVRR